jgi:eukaryotic-like serine/threonine-protein kinase
MPITAGDQLGAFVIREPIGKGGMGEVYLAFDPRLGREVAIKVLLGGAVGNAERRARFLDEAKLASALNHRNIVTIYDVDSAEVDGNLVDFVAMQYVPGKTLDKLIGRRGLRVSDALRYAAQIADGLAAAHHAGIIHRDLKPANIIVSEQGEIKILDFGLAKLIEPEQADAWADTESVHLQTAVGVIAGTAAYMSPEQAEGLRVDERSDIFSFGAVLYEMVTGRRAFSGASKLSTLASVLHTDPGSITQTHEKMPRELDRIVDRCLRKDPRRRWQNAADLKIALEDLAQESDGSQSLAAEPSRQRSPWRRWTPVYGTALAILALAAGLYVGANSLAHPRPTFERLTFQRGNVAEARFSPDGTVLFSAQWGAEPTRIFSMRPGSDESRPLDLPGAVVLSISSAGEMAILLGSPARSAPGTLARVPLSGGAPRAILDNVNDADWSPDGANLAVSRTVNGRNRIEYPIGNVLIDGEIRPPQMLHVSPKGDLLAFLQVDNAIGDYAVTLLDLHGRKRVLSRGWRAAAGLCWAPKGDEIWFGGTRIGGEPAFHAVKLNGEERILLEAPVAMSLEDIARDGRVLAAVEDSRIGILALAPGAIAERDLSWFEASRVYDISADGKSILFGELTYGKPRNIAIYIRGTDGAPAIRLGDGNHPVLSPDGKWVACIASDGSGTTLNLLPTGAGEARMIGPPGMHYDRVDWFPDGKRVLFQGSLPNRPPRTFALDIDGGRLTPLTPERVVASYVSPDQEYAAVVAGAKLTLWPISGGAQKPVVNLEAGESLIGWSKESRFVFLRKSLGPARVNILRLDLLTGRRELCRELRTPDPVGVQIGPVAITPDGKSYAYSFERDISTLYLAQGLR